MKKLSISKYRQRLMLSLLTLMFLFNGCSNPANNIDILFDAAVITYKATVQVTDANGGALPGLTVTVTGADAASIYDFSGTKVIYSPGGIITLGVTPKDIPTATRELSFNVLISAAGYESLNLPVQIVNGQVSQVIKATLLKSLVNTPVSTYVSKTAALNATGATISATTVTTNISGTVPTTASVSIAENTQFRNAAGSILTGSDVRVQIINFDAGDAASNELFPGGGLAASNVIMPGSATATSAFFVPALFANIRMFVGTEEVKTFTKPVTVSIQLNPTAIPHTSGATYKIGDQIPLYSYQVATGQFAYESLVTVTSANNKLTVAYTISHLTVFVAGEVFDTGSCAATKVTLTAPWLLEATRPLQLEISDNTNRILSSTTLLASNELVGTLAGLPSIPLKYRMIDVSGEVLATGTIASPCAGTPLIIAVSAPSTALTNVTLQLNVVCPGKGTILIPNFDMYFRPVGSAATSYSLLGTANRGLIKTTLLNVGSTYQFKAIWGSQVKILTRTITNLDMSTVVGQNLELGKNVVANNALLIEACKTLN